MDTDVPIGMHVRFDGPFEEAIAKVTDALETERFGFLTEINVQATLRKKLDIDFRRYKTPGASSRVVLARLDPAGARRAGCPSGSREDPSPAR